MADSIAIRDCKAIGKGNAMSVTIIRNNYKAFISNNRWSVLGDETDSRCALLTEIDFNQVRFVTMLDGEMCITGEERLSRLKASNYLRLDVDTLFTLVKYPQLIPKSLRETIDDENCSGIDFPGTVFRDWVGRDWGYFSYVPYMYSQEGALKWGMRWLDHDVSGDAPSAVLER